MTIITIINKLSNLAAHQTHPGFLWFVFVVVLLLQAPFPCPPLPFPSNFISLDLAAQESVRLTNRLNFLKFLAEPTFWEPLLCRMRGLRLPLASDPYFLPCGASCFLPSLATSKISSLKMDLGNIATLVDSIITTQKIRNVISI